MKLDSYLADIRVEVAFGTDPDAAVPAWVDVTDWVKSDPGISIGSYGRGDEYSTTQQATCEFTVDNTSGQWVPDNPLSQWYPNVDVLRRVRVSARRVNSDGSAIPGNNFADPSFNQATLLDWSPSGSPSPALSLDATHTRSAGKAMLITWAAGNIFFPGPIATLNCVIGRSYWVLAYVYVPAGSPNVQLVIGDANGFFVSGAFSSGTNSFVPVSVIFTAQSAQPAVHVLPQGSPSAGQQCWVDDCDYDEGAAVGSFTTTPMRYDPAVGNIACPVFDRYTGYISDLPTEWPGGGQYSEARISCVDRFSRLGDDAQLRSMLEEEVLYDAPFAYYTLGEPAAATMVGDTSDNGRGPLAIAQAGVNGTITFAAGTGPARDALPAVQLAPQDTSNGKYLSGNLGVATDLFNHGHTLESFFLTSTANLQTIAYAAGPYGGVLRLSIDATGHLVGSCVFGGVVLTSATVVADGLTHHAALVESISGTTVTCTLYLDGASAATGSYTSAYGLLATVNQLSIGGGLGRVFAGTLAHTALYDTALATARIADHAAAGFTGLAGERSDQRIARLARYQAIPASEQQLDVGLSTSIAATDTSGSAPLAAMQQVETTEGGVLFTNMSGKLAFHSRNHRYNAVTAATLAVEDLDAGARFVRNRAYLINRCNAGRPDGISVTAVNRSSRNRWGERKSDVTLLTTSDNEVVDAANWKANQTAQLTSRLPNLQVDLLTNPNIAAGVGLMLALDVSSQVAVSGLPASAPGGGAAVLFFLEGRSETISETSWSISWNTSPALQGGVWQLDSSSHSQLDSTTRLAY